MKMTHRIQQFLQLFAIVTTFCCEAIAAPEQNGGFSVKAVKRSDWQFPVLEEADSKIAERINDLMLVDLFELYLEAIPPENPEQSLAVLTENEFRSIPSLDFKVLRNDARLFSVLFIGDGCGAYCEYFQRPMAFDSATGRLLTAMDLFSHDGRKALIGELVNRNRQTLQDRIKKAQASPPSESNSAEDAEAIVGLYKECLESWQSNAWRHTVGSMEFHPSELVFVHGRCSNHIQQALDDLGELRNPFSYAALKPWLSDYGRRLLLGEGSNGKPASALGQWLKGTIGGKTRITLYLSKPYLGDLDKEPDIRGYYFYDRYKKPLKLQGKWQNGKFFLEEFDRNETAQAALILENDGSGGLLGQWKSGDGKKVLPIKLDP
jgi:hypothetical protein